MHGRPAARKSQGKTEAPNLSLGGLLEWLHERLQVKPSQMFVFVTGFTCEAGPEAIGGLHR